MNVILGLPEDLQAAYKGIKKLCETIDTPLNIHSYARQMYETFYHSGGFVDASQKTVAAGRLFTAQELINQDGMFRKRKISYNERSILAPAADEDVLRVFADLEKSSRFKFTEGCSRDGGEDVGRKGTDKAEGSNAAVIEDEYATHADSTLNESHKQLLAASKRIVNFSGCRSILSSSLV